MLMFRPAVETLPINILPLGSTSAEQPYSCRIDVRQKYLFLPEYASGLYAEGKLTQRLLAGSGEITLQATPQRHPVVELQVFQRYWF